MELIGRRVSSISLALWLAVASVEIFLLTLLLCTSMYRILTASIEILAGMIVVAAAPVKFRRSRLVKSIAIVSILVSVFITLPWSLKEMNQQTTRLTKKLDKGGPSSFSFDERFGVYMLGIWMAGLGSLVYPEASIEHFCLYRLSHNRRHVWESPFPMTSPRIRRPLVDFARQLPDDAALDEEVIMKVTRIAWGAYSDNIQEKRVALALNPCILRAVARRNRKRWTIYASVTVRVEYPRRSRITLFKYGNIRLEVEEGLFWALQQIKWLHPYTGEWIWTISVDDLRRPG